MRVRRWRTLLRVSARPWNVVKALSCEGPILNAVLSSLAAYLAAGVRPPTPLAKAIVLVLVVKLMAIVGAGVFLFSSRGLPVVDSNAVSRLIGPVGVVGK